MEQKNAFTEGVIRAYIDLLATSKVVGSCCIQAGMIEAHNAQVVILGDMTPEREEYCLKFCITNVEAVIGGQSISGVVIDNDWFASCFGLETPDQNKLMAETVIACIKENQRDFVSFSIELQDCRYKLPYNAGDAS